MTTRSLPRLPLAVALAGLVALALVGVGCRRLAKPEGWASPVLVPAGDGTSTLLVSHKDRLYSFDAATLEVHWAFPTGQETEKVDVVALYGEPTTAGGTVFVPGYDDYLYAINAENGALRRNWPFPTGDVLVGGVTAGEDRVYFGSSDGNVYAVNFDGTEAWSFKSAKRIWSTPVLSMGKLYVTSLDGNLYALDAQSGDELWKYKTGAGIAGPPVVDESLGLIYLGGFDNKLRGIDMGTHKERWEIKADNWFWTRPLLANGVVYAGSLDGRVYAVDAATGDPAWPAPFETLAEIHSAPVLVGDVLLIIDRDGNVYGISAADGTPAFQKPLALAEDVLTDPVVRPASAGASDQQLEMIVVTKAGSLIVIDPVELKVVERKPLSGD
ncbi:MAG: PQQ-binding-like beta-propeller repeat protein [Dehalococcoidia bacterium]